MCVLIISKLTEKQGFIHSLENTVLGKPQGWGQIEHPTF